ncbi:hypothetical protein BR93DRAFT_926328 [Coniochaeta sp. PMI_546]|nr:hypothetical protein BR93DRAFT_926328 [Coniochaeta sp. PMI_546]
MPMLRSHRTFVWYLVLFNGCNQDGHGEIRRPATMNVGIRFLRPASEVLSDLSCERGPTGAGTGTVAPTLACLPLDSAERVAAGLSGHR